MNKQRRTTPFATVLMVELYKLRRSLALLLAVVAPGLITVFLFFNLMRMEKPMPWAMMLQSSAAIWAFFMLPMSVTALTALIAHTEHGNRSWDPLHALPIPRWYFYAAKLLCVLLVVLAMSALLALLSPLALSAASALNPAASLTGSAEYLNYLQLLGRIFLAAWLLIGVQLWVALHYGSFVPALALGIGGTFFAVVATSAKIGVLLPWQIPVNQLAGDPDRAALALALGGAGGCLLMGLMLWRLSRREWL